MVTHMTQRPSAFQREIKQTKPFPTREQEAAVALLRTADVLRRDIEAALKPYGISLQQYNVLRILRGARPAPLPTLEVAERMIEHAPGVTRLLDKIETRKLVRRERCREDRRRVLCSITPAGLELLRRLNDPVIRAETRRLGRLEKAGIGKFLDALDRLREERD